MSIFTCVIIVAAAVIDMVLPFILAPFYPGYSHSRQVMSVLGNRECPVHYIYSVWLVVLGILLILANKGLYLYFRKDSQGLAIGICIFIDLFAIGAGILAGLFSVNSTKEVQTVASQIHGAGAALGFMALLIVPLLITVYFFRQKDYWGGGFSCLSFVLALVFFILFIMADKDVFQDTIISRAGLWQRLSLLFMYVPLLEIVIAEC